MALDESKTNELQVLSQVLDALTPLEADSQTRILETAATFFRLGSLRRSHSQEVTQNGDSSLSSFSEDRALSPKAFIMQKEPRSDVERVACLAYYLTHYRDTPHFKTLDISKLNTEAAQIKFSNPTVAVNNAMQMHYLVPASGVAKQLSALGEQFVLALPNREAAKAVMANDRTRRRTKKSVQSAQPSAEEITEDISADK